MDRRQVMLGLVIALCIAIPLAGIGFAIDYTGTTQSAEQQVDVKYVTVTLNGSEYSGSFSKSILYTSEWTIDGTTYIPVNKSGVQTLVIVSEQSGSKQCVSCGSVNVTVAGSGDVLPEYTFSMNADGNLDDSADIFIKYQIGEREAVTERYTGEFSVDIGGTPVPGSIYIELLVGVSTCTEIPANPLDNVTFEFKAEVSEDDP